MDGPGPTRVERSFSSFVNTIGAFFATAPARRRAGRMVYTITGTTRQRAAVRGPTDPIHPGRERYARYVAALYESAQFASGAGMERYREWWPFDPP
ncbi:MAG TPA: hypothetical protein VFC51_17565, partial [Chloroflexota bacterium]|nr:hypothetical protein [Chloroflexota bacterium]